MIVVYTVVTNNYDDLDYVKQEDDVVYIAITDDMTIESNGWFLMEGHKHNRWYKFHPHELFPDVEYTIYIDAHAWLVKHPKEIVKELGDHSIGQQKHPVRDCLYAEAEVCVIMNLDSIVTVNEATTHYLEEGLPHGFGLFANGCIVRQNIFSARVWSINCWWHLQELELKRDQLVTPYVSWKTGIKPKPIEMFGWGNHKNV